MESAGTGRTGRHFGAGKSGYPDVGRHVGGDTKAAGRSEGEEELSPAAGSEIEGVWQRREAPEGPRRQIGKQSARRAWSIIPARSDRRRQQGAVSPTAVGG